MEILAAFNVIGFFALFIRVEHRLTKIETACVACKENKSR